MLVCQVVVGVRSSTRTWEDGGVFVWMGQKVAGIVCASQRPSSLCTALPTQHGACTESVSENTWQQITRWFCHPGDHGVFFVWSFLTHNINFGCCLFGKQQQTELEHKKVKKIFIQAPWQYPVIKSTIVNETTKSQTCSTLHNWELESQRDC